MFLFLISKTNDRNLASLFCCQNQAERKTMKLFESALSCNKPDREQESATEHRTRKFSISLVLKENFWV
jgi:hypothetical protein